MDCEFESVVMHKGKIITVTDHIALCLQKHKNPVFYSPVFKRITPV